MFNTVHSYFKEQLAQHAGLIEQVMDARDIRRIVDEGRCAAMFTVEGGSFLGEELDRVYEAADLGVKMITLTWNDKNAIASGNKTTDGLSFFGRDVVRTMEKRRVVVDVSHLNDRSFWEVLEVAERPLVASHSNSRKICAHPRNLTDDQFRAIVERGGLVGLNYCKRFLSEAGHVTHDDVLRHVDHLLELGGEHVLALGSDYDGCDVPEWLCPAEKVGISTTFSLGNSGKILPTLSALKTHARSLNAMSKGSFRGTSTLSHENGAPRSELNPKCAH